MFPLISDFFQIFKTLYKKWQKSAKIENWGGKLRRNEINLGKLQLKRKKNRISAKN